MFLCVCVSASESGSESGEGSFESAEGRYYFNVLIYLLKGCMYIFLTV